KEIEHVEVQWSTNEKVALEIAAGASWAGKKALCTMKMSGLNVAYDSLISLVYSGCTGALVLYVCDDPGVSAGMPEQDVRGFAKMSDMPIIDLCSVVDSYELTLYAFALSERIASPVMLRSVTSVSLSHATVDLPEMQPPAYTEPILVKDIAKFTKAGAKICMDQHADLIARLEKAKERIYADGINRLAVQPSADIGVIVAGVCGTYLKEGLEIARKYAEIPAISSLWIRTTIPCPTEEIDALLRNCRTLAVIEENEPYIEDAVFKRAYLLGVSVTILGKESGTLSRIGSFNALSVAKALLRAVGRDLPEELGTSTGAAAHCAARPIGVCAGCPHRGVFMSINDAIVGAGYKRGEVVVTGDIGCTILGMSPPFLTLWTEVSMGASISLAQGYKYAGVKAPVIATMGDSTFIHGGMPGLANAVWNNVDVTLILMDNGWTGMTGMQVNPGTAMEFQRDPAHQRLDIAKIIPALGVKEFAQADPYDVPALTALLKDMLKRPGVKVILARQECAIQSGRRKVVYGRFHVDPALCTRCKACILKTGCPGLVFDGEKVSIDRKQCNGCGICSTQCRFQAIVRED
ncbi:MAG: indolepyruvate ferredoxin oxidoreductase subunit alpha, partial [Clostridia bacterium]|nr:indolepyruvate ferredoxin oxidoreductase subunit alpha [Clostridia bacterium]